MKRIVFILLLVLLISSLVQAESITRFFYAEIGRETYLLEVADTWKKRQQGLSNRESLGRDTGMVFVFDQPANYSFWMHQMLFPLDFIYIKEDKVVALKEKVPPPTDTKGVPRALSVKEPADKIIELYAGEIKNNGIKIGDLITFKPAN
jgi:uncharacterized membrane protein (UPF0127 family)